MENKLLELSGISNPKEYSFKWEVHKKIEGSIDFDNKEVIGASISNKVLNYKELDGFNEINFDSIEIFNNLLILNTSFNISLEYSEGSSFGRLNLLNSQFYKTFTLSLKNYTFSSLDIQLLVVDFSLLPLENKLYYYADILIGINEL